jgi:peroxiredoxin
MEITYGVKMSILQPPVATDKIVLQDFSLLGVDGEFHTIKDIISAKGTLIMFICNHCPYVRAIIQPLVTDVQKLQEIGVSVVAINSNDPINYPEDSYENMIAFAQEHNFTFPYLFDETQEVAHNYGAVCTPDFFGFNSQQKLQYRGRFDSSGMSFIPNAKHELLLAMQEIVETDTFIGAQNPSIGCSIKWRNT